MSGRIGGTAAELEDVRAYATSRAPGRAWVELGRVRSQLNEIFSQTVELYETFGAVLTPSGYPKGNDADGEDTEVSALVSEVLDLQRVAKLISDSLAELNNRSQL